MSGVLEWFAQETPSGMPYWVAVPLMTAVGAFCLAFLIAAKVAEYRSGSPRRGFGQALSEARWADAARRGEISEDEAVGWIMTTKYRPGSGPYRQGEALLKRASGDRGSA